MNSNGKGSPIRRRIAPSHALKLELKNEDGSMAVLNLKLSWDFNVAARIEEKAGVDTLSFDFLQKLGPTLHSIIFWACLLREQPEYDSDEGLDAVRSWMDESNSDQIFEAWWAAYLGNLPEKKRELLVKMRTEEEKRSQEPGVRSQEAAKESPLAPESPVPSPRPSVGSTSGPSDALTFG